MTLIGSAVAVVVSSLWSINNLVADSVLRNTFYLSLKVKNTRSILLLFGRIIRITSENSDTVLTHFLKADCFPIPHDIALVYYSDDMMLVGPTAGSSRFRIYAYQQMRNKPNSGMISVKFLGVH